MSERDELGGVLSNTVCNASNYARPVQPHILGSDMSVVLDKTADAILAAGYRKPRTVTTAEELDALPVGSVVLDHAQPPCAWQKDGDGIWWFAMAHYRQGKDSARLAAQINGVTVLHRGQG